MINEFLEFLQGVPLVGVHPHNHLPAHTLADLTQAFHILFKRLADFDLEDFKAPPFVFIGLRKRFGNGFYPDGDGRRQRPVAASQYFNQRQPQVFGPQVMQRNVDRSPGRGLGGHGVGDISQNFSQMANIRTD